MATKLIEAILYFELPSTSYFSTAKVKKKSPLPKGFSN